MTKTVLFDLDGTLLDTERDFTGILNSQLASYGKPPVSSQQMRNTVSSGARAMIMLGFGIIESDPTFNDLLAELLDRYQARIPQTECELFPGVTSMLEALNSKSAPWGIVTNKPSRFTDLLVESIPALQKSQVVVCADHVSERKPDPEGILLACSKLECDPASVLYVGDHPKDVQAAASAGATSIAVRWGYIPEEHPIDTWNADIIINHPNEILDHLDHQAKPDQ